MNQLENYIQKVQKENKDVTAYLKETSPSINENRNELIIKCALSIALPDGKIDESEMKAI